MASPIKGIFYHGLGGVGAASFYVPLKRIQNWAWESYWLVSNTAFLLCCPWLVAFITTPRLMEVISGGAWNDIGALLFLGFWWGLGAMSFGLSLRYLGMSLSFSVALGFCTICGGLVPPIIKSLAPNLLASLNQQSTLGELAQTKSGQLMFVGVVVSLLGITICGWAGIRKERELSEEAKKLSVGEFNFWKGIGVALICGLLSSLLNVPFTDTEPLTVQALSLGTNPIWANATAMAIFLSGGAISTIAWCLVLNGRNRTGGDYLAANRAPLAANYFLCVVAGILMYGEYFFYALAAPQMGENSFLNLPIHLALVIGLGNIWAIVFKEWNGTSRATKAIIAIGIAVLLLSTVFMGWSAYEGLPAASTIESPPPVL